jgi:hypothetical protein
LWQTSVPVLLVLLFEQWVRLRFVTLLLLLQTRVELQATKRLTLWLPEIAPLLQ